MRKLPIGVLAVFLIAGCGGGGGSSNGTDKTSGIVNLQTSTLSSISTSSAFLYTFTKDKNSDVTPSSVTDSNFFIQPYKGLSATIADCNASARLDATVTQQSSTEYLLNPSQSLSDGTGYAICVMPGSGGSGVFYSNGDAFEGDVITISTDGASSLASCTTTSDCSGDLCFYGKCIPKSDMTGIDFGTTCSIDSDCSGGNVCATGLDNDGTCTGYCAEPFSSSSKDGNSLVPMTEQTCSDAGFDWYTIPDSSSAFCFEPSMYKCIAQSQNSGGECSTNSDCTTVGDICFYGACEAQSDLSNVVDFNSTCTSAGDCKDSTDYACMPGLDGTTNDCTTSHCIDIPSLVSGFSVPTAEQQCSDDGFSWDAQAGTSGFCFMNSTYECISNDQQ